MTDELKDLEELVTTRLVRVNASMLGIAVGFVAGLALFVATAWLVIKGGETVGPHLGLLGQYFIGYQVTWLGAVVGFLYAFACGWALGFSGAWLYNRVADLRHGKPAA